MATLTLVHDHETHNCIEVLVLRGKAGEIRRRADLLVSVKGVKHGKLTRTTTGEGGVRLRILTWRSSPGTP